MNTSIESEASTNSESWKPLENYKILVCGKEVYPEIESYPWIQVTPISSSSRPFYYYNNPSGSYDTIWTSNYYTYELVFPISLDLGTDIDYTLDGNISIPFICFMDISNKSTDYEELWYTSLYDCEFYDSNGNRVAVSSDYNFNGYDSASDKEIGFTCNFNFNNNYVSESLDGFIKYRVGVPMVTMSGGVSDLSNVRLQYVCVFDSDSKFFDSSNSVKYCVGDISDKKTVTYQKPGEYVQNEDGSFEWKEGETVTEDVNQEEQNGGILSLLGNLPKAIGDMLVGIIVPSSEEMSDLFNRLNDFFAETFGFLYYPFDFIIDAFNIFLEADSETGLTLPGFSIMGYEVWGNQTYDLASEPVVGTIFGYVRMGTGAMLAMWFVNYLRNFFDKRFGGGGT